MLFIHTDVKYIPSLFFLLLLLPLLIKAGNLIALYKLKICYIDTTLYEMTFEMHERVNISNHKVTIL